MPGMSDGRGAKVSDASDGGRWDSRDWGALGGRAWTVRGAGLRAVGLVFVA